MPINYQQKKNTNIVFGGTAAITIPIGTTSERPTGVVGMLRFNTTTSSPEVYLGTAWSGFGATKDGSSLERASGSPAQIKQLLGTTPPAGVYWYKNAGYNSNTAFQAYTDWSINNGTGYMILTQTQTTGPVITNYTDIGTASTSVSGTRGHGNTFREPTATILSSWSGDTANRAIVAQYRLNTGTNLATSTNVQWIQIAVTPATFKNMFDNIPGAGEFTGTISARSAGGTGSFYWSKNNSEYPNHNQMGNASTDNGWNGNNYIEIRQAGGDTNHGFFVAGDGGGGYYVSSRSYNGGSDEKVAVFGFAPDNFI